MSVCSSVSFSHAVTQVSRAETCACRFQVCVVQALWSHVRRSEMRVAEQLHPVRPLCEPVLLPRLLPELQRGGPDSAVQAV